MHLKQLPSIEPKHKVCDKKPQLANQCGFVFISLETSLLKVPHRLSLTERLRKQTSLRLPVVRSTGNVGFASEENPSLINYNLSREPVEDRKEKWH